MDKKNVGIVGATGYVGEELLSILDNSESSRLFKVCTGLKVQV